MLKALGFRIDTTTLKIIKYTPYIQNGAHVIALMFLLYICVLNH